LTFGIPESTLLLPLVAIAFVSISNLLTRRLVDLDAERRIKAEINAYTRSLRAAMKAGDKAAQEKIKRKEQSINQMKTKMSGARSKIAIYTLIPFIGGYYLVIYLVVGGPETIAAYSPFPISIFSIFNVTELVQGVHGYGVYSWSLYFLSSATFSGLISRLMKTQT